MFKSLQSPFVWKEIVWSTFLGQDFLGIQEFRKVYREMYKQISVKARVKESIIITKLQRNYGITPKEQVCSPATCAFQQSRRLIYVQNKSVATTGHSHTRRPLTTKVVHILDSQLKNTQYSKKPIPTISTHHTEEFYTDRLTV